MNIDNIIYLKNILGEEEARKYLNADEERLKLLVEVLKKTSIKRILSEDALNEFCNKIAYAKYAKVYANVLSQIGKFKMHRWPINYELFLIYYIQRGYNSEYRYKELFEELNYEEYEPIKFNKDELNLLIEKEIEDAKEDKITVGEFIKNGGSLEELIGVMNKLEIKDFNEKTKIPVSLLETMKSEKYEVSITQIGYLVSIMFSLDLGKKTQIELLETYYNGLKQNKQNGFSTDVLVVENKQKLYKFLKSKNMIANILNDEKKDIKYLEKVK